MELLPDELKHNLIDVLNSRLFPFRKGPVLMQKLVLSYVIFGAIILCILGALLAIFVSFWIAIVVAAIYFAGLFIVIKVSNSKGKKLEK